MKLYHKIGLGACLLASMASCKKSYLQESPPNILVADNLFANYDGYQNALNGLYYEVRRSRSGVTTSDPVNDMMFEMNVIGVDNGYGNYVTANTEGIFNSWGALNNAGQGYYSKTWAYLYETINSANTIIDRSAASTVLSDAQRNSVQAEARCIRAWAYRHLTYLWGDVPLQLHESTGENVRTDYDRTPVATIHNQMKADWQFADQYLPVTSSNNGKLIKGVAEHYLAELYLADNKPDSAKIWALKVTTNANYKLVTARYGVNATKPGTAFTDMFLDGNSNRSEGNTEALWVLQNELNVVGGEGNNIMRRYWVNRYYSLTVKGTDNKTTSPFAPSADFGGRGIGRLGPTKWAFSIYDATDDRGGDFAWRFSYAINTNPPKGYVLGQVVPVDRTATEKVSNPNYPNTRKWDYTSPLDVNGSQGYNDQIYLRAGETYLLLAEADFKTGDLQGAVDAINALRNRAHATPATLAQINLDFILDERSRELFTEEDRRYTLLRTGTWLTRTKAHNALAGATITTRDQLLPIPQDVIDANLTKKFPQNPGY
ncbi:RagB/SusD family nutrient uptake outer membrane protein [Mucilaginibacter mali]|uniref:RagB/SusD family nutrient uptake outer membrane protein n=1 Tax=Mucilaginibacter mali TaxID=2740462 RepID=A0A7D4Q764_9SPHI|nr:RagB/SusD family nutrient uptake outer membrane protein [Mucilaginibacter mali]QKJ29025.1 RagB/SusD family nutrient uptake outer membrane protein [Mucilaginibacter mali]